MIQANPYLVIRNLYRTQFFPDFSKNLKNFHLKNFHLENSEFSNKKQIF